MNLILLEPEELADDGTAVLSGPRARHVREVLRSEPGAILRVGLIDGPMGTATVLENAPRLKLNCELNEAIPPRPRVDLLLAMPRPKVLNRLWPVLASLGVGRVIISNAWKSERNYFDTHVLEPAHIRKGLIEGLQQARDTRLPLVTVHRQFKKLMEDELDVFGPYAAKILAHPADKDFPQKELAALPVDSRILLAIGPEGGWTHFELEMLTSHGFTAASWGPRSLRTDTACAVLLGLVHAALR